MDKFKSNPYNHNNVFIQEKDIINIMNKLNIIDFKPNNLSFYKTSFIHTSYCKLNDYKEYIYPGEPCLKLQDTSYETMEFLGDAILESVTCSYIYKRFYEIHKQNEGFLTKLKIRIVCGENLSYFSENLNFNKFLIISKNIEDNCNGRNNQKILNNVFESFIGAIFLDKGYHFAETFIINVIETYFDFTETLLQDNNYKDQIIRYFHNNFKKNPTFTLIENCDEDGIYYCEFSFNNKLICKGEGNTRKKAEQDVSKKALIKYNVLT
tara:strand:+ start:765 stop:1562 length:798 start_codon:yes stop_codon:yes gene_type:complete